MGQKFPVPDERTQKVVDMLQLEKKHLAKLWKVFQRYDKDGGGTIDVEEFYKLIGEERTVFGDSIFELVDLDNTGTLDFGEFVTVIGTYCMFGRDDILKFCFYVFDKDKNGYIEQDELFALVEMLHGNNPNANCNLALDKFDTNSDGKIDFKEFNELNVAFPMLLFPAYKIQESMMETTMGQNWWKSRKEMLMQERQNAASQEQMLKLKELKRQRRKQIRELKHKMGTIGYYLFFWKRQTVLAQIAAEQAIREEKRAKRLAIKELESKKQENKAGLKELFSDKKRMKITPEESIRKEKVHKSKTKEQKLMEETKQRKRRHEEKSGRTTKEERRKRREKRYLAE